MMAVSLQTFHVHTCLVKSNTKNDKRALIKVITFENVAQFFIAQPVSILHLEYPFCGDSNSQPTRQACRKPTNNTRQHLKTTKTNSSIHQQI